MPAFFAGSQGLLIAAVLVAGLDWLAVAKKWRTLGYLAKPGVMVVLMLWLWIQTAWRGPLLWFGLGLCFSMIGDILLMLPRERFVRGLTAFLAAHLCYIAGFNTPPVLPNLAGVIVGGMILVVGLALYRCVRAALVRRGLRKLRLPAAGYAAALGLMLYSALLTLTRPDWLAGEALLAAVGGLFFFVSDSTLAWNRFVAHLPYGRLRVRVTYHLGQVLLILGAALHFMNLPG